MADVKRKNLKWTRDGTILILALYKEYYSKYLQSEKSDEKIQNINPNKKDWTKYNNLIRKLPDEKGNRININVSKRSYLGIESKIRIFYQLNPYDNRKGLGEGHITELEKKVWDTFKDEFAPDKIKQKGKLEKEVERIIKSIDSEIKAKTPIEYDVGGNSVSEGAKKIIREHKVRERNPAIIIEKKNAVKREKGFLACEVCCFIFKDTYGKHGEDFIECHHKKPIAQMKTGDKTFPIDLALVCSNCHRMIHHTSGDRKDCLTIEELRKIIAKNKSK